MNPVLVISLLALGATERPKPNILFFFSDDHTTQAISAYGSTIATTPNIDRIAARGMRFDRMMANNAICAPSRAAVLTGTYGHVNGKIDNHGAFDGSQPTLQALLQSAGYQTALFGKWHLVSEPTGFDEYGILRGQGQYFNPIWITPSGEARRPGYVADVITDESLQWLAEKRDPDKPFFLMVNHKAPHANWQWHERYETVYPIGSTPPPETLRDDLSTRTSTPRSFSCTMHTIGATHLTVKPPPELEGDDRFMWNYHRYISDYLRTAQSIDDSVGRILDRLEASGLAETTLVIYASDQGFFLGEHGWFDKRLPYDEALIMPFIMAWPKLIPPGTTNAALLGNHDILPTLLDVAGVAPPSRVQGRSFRVLAEGGPAPDWTRSFYYRFYERGWGIDSEIEAVRTETHKLIHYIDAGEWELYDLAADPREICNLHPSADSAPLRHRMEDELKRLRTYFGAPAKAQGKGSASP